MIYSIHGIPCDSNYLEHHGIKGQKWGVRNGPPYPLGAGDHSKAEQKAGWRSSLGENREANVKRSQGSPVSKASSGKKADTKTGMDPILAAYLMYAAAVAAAYVATAAKHQIDKKLMDKKVNDISSSKTTDIDEETGFHVKPKDDDTPIEEDIKNVNPMFDGGKKRAASVNCVLCSTAVELRARGYDVMALGSANGYDMVKYMHEAFPDSKMTRFNGIPGEKSIYSEKTDKKNKVDFDNKVYLSPEATSSRNMAMLGTNSQFTDKVYSELARQPDSRGVLAITYGVGGGHALAYSVKDGKVTIYDGQSGKVYSDKNTIGASLLNFAYDGMFYRTDNVDFNLKKIKEAVV